MIEKYGPDWEVVVGGVGIKVNGENDKENEDLVYFWLKKARRAFGAKFDDMLRFYASELRGLKMNEWGFEKGENLTVEEFVAFVQWCKKFASLFKGGAK